MRAHYVVSLVRPQANILELRRPNFPQLDNTLLRTARRRTVDEVWTTVVAECLASFSPTECRNYFRHCGYSATTQL
jgi:hypothetical protein